jgi:hypothetical protein
MDDGLSKEDADKVAKALLEAMKADESTLESSKSSVVKILENAGGQALGKKLSETDLETWGFMWNSIKEFFVQIWNGIVGSVEALVESISEWFS